MSNKYRGYEYNGYEIMAECQVATGVYRLNDKGELGEWYEEIDSEPYIHFYGIYKDGEAVDWIEAVEGIKGAKQLIDWYISREDEGNEEN